MMKKSALILVLLFWLNAHAKTILLAEAIKEKKVSFKMECNAISTHYIRPLKAYIINKTKEPMELVVEAGNMFNPEDSNYQNMLITKTDTIRLAAKKSVNAVFYAMCTESGDIAPKEGVKYRYVGMTDIKMKSLADIISQKKYYGQIEAQFAVWSMAGARKLEAITGYDTASASVLKKFVADIKKLPVPKPTDDYEHNYYSRDLVKTLGGGMEYFFSKKTNITIAMFDRRGTVVRELYHNDSVEPGKHKFTYEFDATVYTDKVYYVRLIQDGNIRIDRMVELN